MNCACKDPNCKQKIIFDWMSKTMCVVGKDETEIFIYLDPNTISELVNDLKRGLQKIVFESAT